jgi:hypothetical protein
VGRSVGEASSRVRVLVVDASSMSAMTALVVGMMLLVMLGVVRVVILMLVFRLYVHLHSISTIVLPVHGMLSMMTLVVHSEGIVCW